MVDHLQSRVTPWRQYSSYVKVRGTLSKMDVNVDNQHGTKSANCSLSLHDFNKYQTVQKGKAIKSVIKQL